MLRLQIWHRQRQHSRTFSHTSSLPWTKSQPVRFINDRHLHTTALRSSIDTSSSQDKRIYDSSVPARRAVAKQHGTQPKYSAISRTSEPWINPDSLSESLEAHRKANHDNIARDGTSARASKYRKFWNSRKQVSQQKGPWVGTKDLRLSDMTSSIHKSNYRGVCPPLLSEWRLDTSLPPRLQFPWLFRVDLEDPAKIGKSAMDRLSAEIRGCGEYFSPSPLEVEAANRVADRAREIVFGSLASSVTVDLIGSRAAGTEGPISDIDLNIKWSEDAQKVGGTALAVQDLRKVDTYMRKTRVNRGIIPHAFISMASVPIVVGTHTSSGIEFQIQSTLSAYDSLEVTKAFIAEYPNVRTLFRILRQMLSMRGLNNGSHGGLTSYPLLNMIVTSMKLASPQPIPSDVASQLLTFFEFWSDFDFEESKIVLVSKRSDESDAANPNRSIDPISAIPKIVPKRRRESLQSFMLSLEDPADLSNDLGRSAHGIRHVQACFIEALARIRKALLSWDQISEQSDEAEGSMSILAWCLGGNYTSFEEARWQLQRFHERSLIDQPHWQRI